MSMKLRTEILFRDEERKVDIHSEKKKKSKEQMEDRLSHFDYESSFFSKARKKSNSFDFFSS